MCVCVCVCVCTYKHSVYVYMYTYIHIALVRHAEISWTATEQLAGYTLNAEMEPDACRNTQSLSSPRSQEPCPYTTRPAWLQFGGCARVVAGRYYKG